MTFVFRHPKYYKDLAANCRRDNKPQRKEEDEEATSDKRLSKKAIKIHEAWAYQNGYRTQATSNKLRRFFGESPKLPGSRYKSSDYSKRAT